LEKFSKTHGAQGFGADKKQTNTINIIEGCSVRVEHRYLLFRSLTIRQRTDWLSLGDFDPSTVRFEPNAVDENNNPFFTAKIERTDAAKKIEATAEMADGSKKELRLAGEFFALDTRDAAERFQKALKHAITLCGGKPAPF
jgi:hypothetical protein